MVADFPSLVLVSWMTVDSGVCTAHFGAKADPCFTGGAVQWTVEHLQCRCLSTDTKPLGWDYSRAGTALQWMGV